MRSASLHGDREMRKFQKFRKVGLFDAAFRTQKWENFARVFKIISSLWKLWTDGGECRPKLITDDCHEDTLSRVEVLPIKFKETRADV